MKTLRRGMIVLLALGTSLFGVRGTGGSQAGGVPRELALGLLKGMYQPVGAPAPEILVGAIPAELIAEIYVPEKATIHGSVVRAAGTIVIATAQLPGDQVKAAYRREMPRRGWSLSEQFDRIGPATQRAVLVPMLFCNQQQDHLMVLVDPARDGSSSIRIDHGPDGEGSPCGVSGRAPERPQALFNLGRLSPPAASPLAPARCLGSASAGMSAASLSTEVGGPEILDHYSRQLEAAGWSRVDAGPLRTFATAWTQYRDGEEIAHAVLSVVQYPQRENCWNIDLTANGLTKASRGGF